MIHLLTAPPGPAPDSRGKHPEVPGVGPRQIPICEGGGPSIFSTRVFPSCASSYYVKRTYWLLHVRGEFP